MRTIFYADRAAADGLRLDMYDRLAIRLGYTWPQIIPVLNAASMGDNEVEFSELLMALGTAVSMLDAYGSTHMHYHPDGGDYSPIAIIGDEED